MFGKEHGAYTPRGPIALAGAPVSRTYFLFFRSSHEGLRLIRRVGSDLCVYIPADSLHGSLASRGRPWLTPCDVSRKYLVCEKQQRQRHHHHHHKLLLTRQCYYVQQQQHRRRRLAELNLNDLFAGGGRFDYSLTERCSGSGLTTKSQHRTLFALCLCFGPSSR